MRKNYYVFILIFTLFLVNGCTPPASSITVLQPKKRVTKPNYHSFSTQEIVSDNNATDVQRKYFKQKLEGLIKKQGFTSGNELILKYRIVRYDEGSQFTRYMVGGMGDAGKGELVVEVEYYNQANQQVGKILSSKTLLAGLFGGDFQETTVDKVAEEISGYTIKNYLRK